MTAAQTARGLTDAQRRMLLRAHRTRTGDDPWETRVESGSGWGRGNYRTLDSLRRLGLVEAVVTHGKPSHPTALASGRLTQAGLDVLDVLRAAQ